MGSPSQRFGSIFWAMTLRCLFLRTSVRLSTRMLRSGVRRANNWLAALWLCVAPSTQKILNWLIWLTRDVNRSKRAPRLSSPALRCSRLCVLKEEMLSWCVTISQTWSVLFRFSWMVQSTIRQSREELRHRLEHWISETTVTTSRGCW